MNREEENLGRPPFAIVESLGPSQVAAEIVACFERIVARPDRLHYSHGLVMRSIGFAADQPLHRAGAAIARDIDGGIGAGVPGGYHNARHFLEVMLCALYLALTVRLQRDRIARVVTAALVHDFHHDGKRSAASPFRLEAQSAAMADPYLRNAGVKPELREQVRALVLSTEVATGVPFARACLGRGAAAASEPIRAGVPAPLELLRTEPELAFEAVLLAEADVLPSMGLTVEHAQYVQDHLAAEWGITLGAADKLKFIEKVRADITLAGFFAPNIEALSREYRQRALQESRAA